MGPPVLRLPFARQRPKQIFIIPESLTNQFRVPKNLAPNRPVSHGDFGDGLGILASSPFCNGYEFCERGFAILGFKFNTGGGT
jgi:hypothetical protein